MIKQASTNYEVINDILRIYGNAILKSIFITIACAAYYSNARHPTLTGSMFAIRHSILM